MSMVTKQQLKSICPYAKDSNLDKYIPHLNMMMDKYDITTVLRISHFIAQVAHESGSFNYCAEIASGAAYEGRKDLGNVHRGDGIKFKGRGLIMITGFVNYNEVSLDIFGDDSLLISPATLEQPPYSVEAACWFWKKHGLNELADKDDIKPITKVINGGYNGLEDRTLFLTRAKNCIDTNNLIVLPRL
jgi:putative chitinase